MEPSKPPRFILLILFFNGLEHFLTSLKIIYTPLLPFLFFSDTPYLENIGFLFQIYPVGIISKPIGTLFFQYIEHYFSLLTTLRISYLGTGISSVFLGALSYFFPEFLKQGLALMYFFQTFFTSNEIVGATKIVFDFNLEDTMKKRLSGWISTSSALGIWFSFGFVLFFQKIGLLKISFFAAHMMGLILILGMFFLPKKQLNSSPIPKNTPEIGITSKALIFLLTGFSAFCYSTAFLVIPSYFFDKNPLDSQFFLISLDVVLLWVFGWILRYYEKEALIKGALWCGLLSPLPFIFGFLEPSSHSLQLEIILLGTLFSAPLYPFLYEVSGAKSRYGTLSWCYLLGSQFFGTMTPIVLLHFSHGISMEKGILISTSLLSIVTLFILNEVRRALESKKVPT
jgi:hypothetical protein